LINLYGSVPLVTSTDYHKNMVIGREPVENIYTRIIADLTEAQTLLNPVYPTSNRLRPNRYTAMSLLAKVYLFQKKWNLSEQVATQIINSGTYKLEPNLNNVFLSSSNEAIWKLSPVFPGVETWEGYYFVPTSSSVIPKYVISNNLLSSFETGDQRKNNWLKNNTVNGQPYYYPYKYKLGYDGAPVPKENYMVFRLGEQYLIRAEARAQQGNIGGALEDLNLIRSRAGLSDFITTDQSTLLADIQHERQVELFCEWANRWFDLKRINNADTVLSNAKGSNWQSTDVLYPVPQTELSKNPSLTQNAGY
jgi:starch-binding outer membrane protein, SusD/RagB family